MKSLNRMVDIILMIAAFFLYPLIFFGLKQDSLTRSAADMNTNALVENVRSNGYIDKEMYEDYLSNLSKTGLTYNIKFEHRLNVLEPEYRFRTPEEIIDAQNSAYTGSNIYTYRPVTTAIPTVLDPVYSGNLNMETNASVLASAINTGASASHVHTEACYSGHKHTEVPNGFTHYHKHVAGSCFQYLKSHIIMGTCNYCGKTAYQWQWYGYWNPLTNSQTYASSYEYTTCMNCGKPLSLSNKVDKFAYGYSCYYDRDADGDGYSDTTDYINTYTYNNMSSPQTNSTAGTGATVKDGCWSYHVHGTLPNAGYNGYWNGEPATYLWYLSYYGVDNYCTVPLNWYFYVNMANTTQYYVSPQYFKIYGTVINGKTVFQFYVPNGGYIIPGYGWYTTYATSNDGTFSKQYLTLSEMVTWLNGNIYKQLYDWCVDKNSANAKYFLKNTAYTGYDYGYYYVEGQPILGYADQDLVLSGSNSSYGGMCQGVANTCTYTDGAANQWNAACGKVGDDTLDCGVMVTAITPTHPTQTIYRNDPLITTVAVTHADGSITTVAATTNFSTANLCQNQTATLTYSYVIDGVTLTKTCTVTVTIVPRNKTCANGHTYNLNSDGSDPGCPYCKAWLKSLTLVTPDDGKLTIYRGTTLELNGVEVKAVYLDGHLELLTEGYSDNLDNNYIGTQTVTVGYKGKAISIVVTVKRNLTKCTICGRFYELYPDDSDPGCPYCAAKTPIFTGNVLRYKKEEYTNDILKEIYDGDGIYYFSRGDFFKVTLINSSRSFGGKMTAAIYKDMAVETIHIEHSGIIREDGQ